MMRILTEAAARALTDGLAVLGAMRTAAAMIVGVRARLVVVVAAGLILAVCVPAAARGDADVLLTSGQLTVTVVAKAGSDGDHGVLIEPFSENNGRDGFRVRQDQFGRPPFREFDADCFHNSILNDVVCEGPRASAFVTMGDGADRVFGLETPGGIGVGFSAFIAVLGVEITLGGAGFPCVEAVRPSGPIQVDLGAGNDMAAIVPDTVCTSGTFPASGFLGRFNPANGGSGNDTLSGGPLGDVLDGGDETDSLAGNDGADTLRGGFGNDTLDGGGGADELTDVAGLDTLRGGSGNDTLTGAADDDVLEGGGDTDVLSGGLGDDTLRGGSGNDELRGGSDGDALEGGAGRDDLSGGFDSDSINARDGEVDEISCGPGDRDRLAIDLRDPAPTDCEDVQRFAVDDGHPGHALKQRLRVRPRGRVVVRIACPRTARTACRGVLTLRHPNRGRVLARGRYRLQLGERDAVSLTVRRPLPRRVLAVMREQGVSKKGPRSSSVLLQVVR